MPKSLLNRVTGGQSRLLHALPANPTTLESHGERGNDHHATGEQQERDLPTVVHQERLPTGANTNCPSEPAAVARPMACELLSGGTSRPKRR